MTVSHTLPIPISFMRLFQKFRSGLRRSRKNGEESGKENPECGNLFKENEFFKNDGIILI